MLSRTSDPELFLISGFILRPARVDCRARFPAVMTRRCSRRKIVRTLLRFRSTAARARGRWPQAPVARFVPSRSWANGSSRSLPPRRNGWSYSRREVEVCRRSGDRHWEDEDVEAVDEAPAYPGCSLRSAAAPVRQRRRPLPRRAVAVRKTPTFCQACVPVLPLRLLFQFPVLVLLLIRITEYSNGPRCTWALVAGEEVRILTCSRGWTMPVPRRW